MFAKVGSKFVKYSQINSQEIAKEVVQFCLSGQISTKSGHTDRSLRLRCCRSKLYFV